MFYNQKENLKEEFQLFMRLEKGDKVVMKDSSNVNYYGLINDNPPKKTPPRYPFLDYLTREVKWLNKPKWCQKIERVGTCSISYVKKYSY